MFVRFSVQRRVDWQQLKVTGSDLSARGRRVEEGGGWWVVGGLVPGSAWGGGRWVVGGLVPAGGRLSKKTGYDYQWCGVGRVAECLLPHPHPPAHHLPTPSPPATHPSPPPATPPPHHTPHHPTSSPSPFSLPLPLYYYSPPHTHLH